MPSTHKKISPWVWVAGVFVVCAVVYGALSSYPRELAVYSDELRYLDVARSLWQGRGLRVRNMPSDYQKILYPLFILPALALKTTAAQITAIGWLNAVYASSAVFPAYALCRAIAAEPPPHGVPRGRGGAAAHHVGGGHVHERDGLSAAVPVANLLYAAGHAGRAQGSVGWCAAAGVWCYLLYLNKEVALYYLIAWVPVRAWALWQARSTWRSELACNAALFGSFAVCFVLAKLTLFRGLGNSYNQTGWLTAEQWGFLPFAIVCDVLFTVLAFGVFPVLLPAAGLRRPAKGSDPVRTQLPLFLLLSLFIGVGGHRLVHHRAGGPALPLAPAAHAVSGAAVYAAAAGHAEHAGRAALRRPPQGAGHADCCVGRRLHRLLPGHRRGRGRQHPAAVV